MKVIMFDFKIKNLMSISRESGVSMVEGMLAIALLSIGSLAVLKTNVMKIESSARNVRIGDIDDLRSYLSSKIDCDQTFALQSFSCNDKNLIIAFDQDSKTIFNKDAAKQYSWIHLTLSLIMQKL
jgi:hypothetical protein